MRGWAVIAGASMALAACSAFGTDPTTDTSDGGASDGGASAGSTPDAFTSGDASAFTCPDGALCEDFEGTLLDWTAKGKTAMKVVEGFSAPHAGQFDVSTIATCSIEKSMRRAATDSHLTMTMKLRLDTPAGAFVKGPQLRLGQLIVGVAFENDILICDVGNSSDAGTGDINVAPLTKGSTWHDITIDVTQGAPLTIVTCSLDKSGSVMATDDATLPGDPAVVVLGSNHAEGAFEFSIDDVVVTTR